MAYGTAAGVAALTPTFTRDGAFYDAGASDTATTPTLAQVNTWLDEVSALMDNALATEAFITPVTDADVLPILNGYVQGIVHDLVHFSRKAGRFYSKRALDAGSSPFNLITSEITDWVKANYEGFVNQGVPQIDGVRPKSAASMTML